MRRQQRSCLTVIEHGHISQIQEIDANLLIVISVLSAIQYPEKKTRFMNSMIVLSLLKVGEEKAVNLPSYL